MFSSLTPHMTGPNTTSGTRKAYICQYARDGVVTAGRGDGSAVEERPTADDPDRQYYVLRGGQLVAPPPMP